ncbi:MAG: Peptidoglycan-binding domain 1 protein [Acidimicrobiales bacterium]|nr:Peptidoglycan-binding domain 1 protein [Acidimicrobiales bacterium]
MAVLVASVVAFSQPADAASSVDKLRQQRRAVQQKRAAQASQLNVLQATNKQVGQALAALDANRRTQEAAAQAARQKAAAETARAAEAKAAEAHTQARLEELRTAVRRLAVDEYMRGHRPELDVSADPSSPMVTARKRSLLSAAVGQSSDVADRLRSTQADLEVERKAAEAAAQSAAAEQRQAEQRLADVKAASEQQQALADQAEARLERALSEIDGLAALDSTLAAQLAREQAALAQQLRSTPRVGRSTAPGPIRRSGSISLTTVRGITVASSIGSKLAALLNAADAAGLSLSGGGYRDSAQQIATRRNNCGTSDYDVYSKPASQCSPPTARPGSSMHEQGLAIDFTNNGSILTRGSRAYTWLKANASGFGLYNLPSEPWHWSVNGD